MKREDLEKNKKRKGLTNTQWIIFGVVIFLLVVFIIAINYSSTVRKIFVGEGELGTSLPVGAGDCTTEYNPNKFCYKRCTLGDVFVGGFCLGASADPSSCVNGYLFSDGCCCVNPAPPPPPPPSPPTMPPPPEPPGACEMTNPNSATASCVIHSPGGGCPQQFIVGGNYGAECCCPECWQTSDCPSGYECQFYECVAGCGGSTAPQCSGVCPQGKTCKHQPSGSGGTGVCECYNDPPQSCSDFTPPNCGTSEGDTLCAEGEVCSPYYQTGGGSECKCASP